MGLCATRMFASIIVWMKCVHGHILSSYDIMDYGGVFCMITCIYLFIAIWLCRAFLLGGETVDTAM